MFLEWQFLAGFINGHKFFFCCDKMSSAYLKCSAIFFSFHSLSACGLWWIKFLKTSFINLMKTLSPLLFFVCFCLVFYCDRFLITVCVGTYLNVWRKDAVQGSWWLGHDLKKKKQNKPKKLKQILDFFGIRSVSLPPFLIN